MTIKWNTGKIGEIGTVVTGKTPSSKNPHHFGEFMPFVTPTDFDSYHKHVRDAERYLSQEGVGALRKKVLPPESVLVTCIGSQMGKVAFTEVDCVTNQQINSIVCDVERVDPHFVYYALMKLYPLLRRLAADGTTMPIVNKGDFERIEIPVPPLSVQQSIAGILGALDDKIEVNRRINRTLEEMAQTLYKHWFVDFGPFQAGEFVDSELGAVPAGWEIVSIHSLANYDNGGAFPQRILSDDPNDGLPVIKISELNSGGITNTTMYFGEDYRPKYELATGDVLFAWSASLGIYLWANGKALLNQHIFNVRPTGRVSKETMYFMLKHVIDEFIAIAAARATTMGHITKGHLKEKMVAIPPDDVLAEFDAFIKPIFDQILNNKIENQVLAETRDYLLPKLLSGEVEVPAAEAVVEGGPAGSEGAGYEQKHLL